MAMGRGFLDPAAWAGVDIRPSRLAVGMAILCLLLFGKPAAAERHALLIAIGAYAEPSAQLKGIQQDLRMARDMARTWGASEERTKVLYDKKASASAIRAALSTLAWTINPGDDVLVYFSGHGVRKTHGGTATCQEALVTQEGRVLMDAVLVEYLQAIAARARRVIMLTDACHSAGLSSKSLERGALEDDQLKYYPAALLPDLADTKSGPDGRTVDACAVQVNTTKSMSRGAASGRVLMLAAAAENEAAFATPQGSLATRAWTHCMKSQVRGTGRDLARCAQEWVNAQQPRRQQTITPSLNPDLPWME